MKTFFITALLAVTVAASAFAAAPKKVNSAILVNFNTEFKNALDVAWLVADGYTRAAFKVDNTKMEVYYNSTCDIIGSSKSITLDQLPVNAKRSFGKRFEGYNVKEAILFEGFGETAYYISGENEKEFVILKVNDNNKVSVFERTKK